MNKFKVGQELQTRSICDYNAIFKAVVVSRTTKNVNIKFEDGTTKRRKIHTNGEGEFIYPMGKYSMCPIFRA